MSTVDRYSRERYFVNCFTIEARLKMQQKQEKNVTQLQSSVTEIVNM